MSREDDDLIARLEAVKAKRGYLLPHHGLLAISSPKLLEAYDAAYTALALDQRVLTIRDREFVWLAILIATDEAAATHHVRKFLDSGGTQAEVAIVLRLTAWACGGPAYRFVAEHWRQHLPGFDLDAAYRSAFDALAAGVAPKLAAMTLVAAHAARGDFDLLRLAIPLAYELGVPELELAEALSLVMFPGSVPYFVEAAGIWLALIREGKVAASPLFAAWARLQGQGGYDEAVGKSSPS